jgi:hypothetical protein
METAMVTKAGAPRVADEIASNAKPWRWRPAHELADEIVSLARTPRLSIGFPAIDEVAPFLAGTIAVVIGPTGRGKSAFVFQVARAHANERGPVAIVSAELAPPLAGARMVAQSTGRSWIDVLAGAVPIDTMRASLRGNGAELLFLGEMTSSVLVDIEAVLAHFRENDPERPALVVVDYVQLLPGNAAADKREQVTANMVALRKLAAKYQAGALVISKGGRGAMRAARTGEMLGAEATEAGADSNAIEHEAAVLYLLGEMRPEDPSAPDGPAIMDVSVVKARFGQADRVVPLRWEGACGRFTALDPERGAAVSASDRRAAKKAEAAGRLVATLELAIENSARTSPAPLSRADLKRTVSGSHDAKVAAIARLVEAGRLIPVCGDGVRKMGGQWPLWVPERVAASGDAIRAVPRVVLDAGDPSSKTRPDPSGQLSRASTETTCPSSLLVEDRSDESLETSSDGEDGSRTRWGGP